MDKNTYTTKQTALTNAINSAKAKELEKYRKTLSGIVTDQKELNSLMEKQKSILDDTYTKAEALAKESLKNKSYERASLENKRELLSVMIKQGAEQQKQYDLDLAQLQKEKDRLEKYNQAHPKSLRAQENADTISDINEKIAGINKNKENNNAAMKADMQRYENVTNHINNTKMSKEDQKQYYTKQYQESREFTEMQELIYGKNSPEYKKALENEEESKEALEENVKDGKVLAKLVEDGVSDPLKSLENITGKIYEKMGTSIDDAIKTNSQYYGRVTARLQDLFNTGLTYEKIAEDVNDKLTTSSLVDSTKYLAKVAEYADLGINYNLEQRALLGTIGDKLVSTFNATNETLLRYIRLQQRDMTYSAVGSEAYLTRFLNSFFNDTSYLNNMYDQVAAALLETTSQMDYDSATSMSYAIQKWLGSLYAVGLSDATVQTLATGFNYLGSGNVSALNSENSKQTLLALATERAGLSYADILTNGLDSGTVDALFGSMVDYLADIAANTSDNVTLSEYARILGITVSDIKAASNLNDMQVGSWFSSNVDYSSSMKEYKNQINNKVEDRTTMAEKIDNLVSNISYTFGNSVADSDWQYLGYRLNNLATSLAGDDEALASKLEDVIKVTTSWSNKSMKTALLETLGNATLSLFSGGLNDIFGIEDENSRRGIYNIANWFGPSSVGSSTPVTTGISRSIVAASVANTDAERALINFNQNETSTTLSSTTIADMSSAKSRTVSDLYAQLFDNHQPINVQVYGLSETTLGQLKDMGVNKLNTIDTNISNIASNMSITPATSIPDTLNTVKGGDVYI